MVKRRCTMNGLHFLAPMLAYPVFYRCAARTQLRIPQRVRAAHNLLMACGSLLAFCASLHHLQGRASSAYDFMCSEPNDAPMLVRAWYWSKVYEWVDTLLLISRNMPVSHLHFNHHMTTASVVASNVLFHRTRSSVFDVGLCLNSFVHVFMYAYYFRPVLALKKLITKLQIAQHAWILGTLVMTSLIKLRGDECHVHPFAICTSAVAFCMYMCQFVNFYSCTYRKSA